MAIDLERLRRKVSGTPRGAAEPVYAEVSWAEHFEDHSCTWVDLWTYMVLAVIVAECVLWFMLKSEPKMVHQFFSLYDHKLHHSTKDMIFKTGVLGCLVRVVFFLDNIWKVITVDRRVILMGVRL